MRLISFAPLTPSLRQKCDKTLGAHLREKGSAMSLVDRLEICHAIADGMAAVDDARLVHGAIMVRWAHT